MSSEEYTYHCGHVVEIIKRFHDPAAPDNQGLCIFSLTYDGNALTRMVETRTGITVFTR